MPVPLLEGESINEVCSGIPGQPGAWIDGMLSQLNLDEKQQAEVSKAREEMKAEMEKAKGDRAAMRPAMQQFMSKVEAILTPEQKKKFEEIRA